jgi:peptidoglycan/xylan/chitin deacetylase (PgdA/CDA1 family)
VCFTVDHEPDCPPWLTATHRGVEEATAPLLAMLADLGVRATWFSTGDVAERYPDAMRAIVAAGHELGCHGHTHRRFDAIDAADAEWELATASAALRRHAPVTSFRAPNLSFPDAYLPVLERHGYALDSSQARYKAAWRRARRRPAPTALARIPASVTSSVLRLPRPCASAGWTRRRAPARPTARRSCSSCTRGSSSTCATRASASTAASTPVPRRGAACAPRSSTSPGRAPAS